MKAKQLMTRDVVCVPRDYSMKEAFAIMHQLRVRHIPVVEGQTLLGIVSDRDILPYTNAGHIVTERTVGEIMTEAPIVVGPRTAVSRVAEIMLEFKIDSIPVVAGKEFIGLITSSDLLTLLLPPYEDFAEPLPFSFNLLSPDRVQRVAG